MSDDTEGRWYTLVAHYDVRTAEFIDTPYTTYLYPIQHFISDQCWLVHDIREPRRIYRYITGPTEADVSPRFDTRDAAEMAFRLL